MYYIYCLLSHCTFLGQFVDSFLFVAIFFFKLVNPIFTSEKHCHSKMLVYPITFCQLT